MKKLTLSPLAERKVLQGIALLDGRDFPDLEFSEDWVQLVTRHGHSLGTGYLSAQNKGIGWVISRELVTVDQKYFETLFLEAWTKRAAYHQDSQTTAYRIFNQDGDGFGGFSVDLYDEYCVFSWYNDFIFNHKERIVSAFQACFPQIKGGYEKIRFKGPGYESKHLFGEEAPETFTVLENGVVYQVFLNDGLMTGIFLDQHAVRGRLVDGLAAGKSLLNMFSYTAAFSVAAAMGGARETVSVDLAKRSRELSEAHFLANGLTMDHHRFIVMDVFEYFKYAKRHSQVFDVIVLDPPSFARNKKKTFSVAKDYHQLISESLEILAPGGILIASTNASNLSIEKFKGQIEKGFQGKPHTYLETYRLPEDFQTNKKDESSNYLKVFTIGT